MSLTSPQKKGLIWGSIATIAVIGIVYFKRQYDYLIAAGTRLVKAKVHDLTLQKINFTAYVEIDNKGDFSADITDQYYNVYVNGSFVSSVATKDAIHLNSNGKTILPLTIKFNPQDVFTVALQNLASFITDKSKIIISVKGRLTAKVGIVTLSNYEFSIDMTLSEILAAENAPVATIDVPKK